MADINLIGNDAAGSERGGRYEEQHGSSNDQNQDAFEGGYLGSYPDSEFENQDPYMEQNYMKKSSKSIMYILIGACIILFGLLIYLLVSDDEKEPTKVATPGEAETTAAQAAKPQTGPVAGPNEAVLENIDALLASFPQNLKLSVLRYSQGEFIIESQSRSNKPIDELNSRIKQVLNNGRIREAKKSRNSATGARIGTIAGSVPQKNIWADASLLAGLNFIGESELKTRIENYCKQGNLKLKDYHRGRTKTENRMRKTMIRIIVMGSRNSATRFLKALNDDKINVNFSKVSFIAEDQSMSSDVVNLIVHIELFKKLA